MRSLLNLPLRALACAILVAGAPQALAAQRVLGGGEDAVTLPGGMLRVGVGGELSFLRDRWRDGALEKLGGGFSFDAFGPAQLTLLGPLQQAVRDLGAPNFAASLGSTRLDLRQRIFLTPFSLEFGATDWLTLAVSAPLVRVRAESQFRLRGDSGRATLGVNPYFLGSAVPAANRATIDQFTAAALSLQARRDGCVTNPGSAPECPTILAEGARVDALISGGGTFAQRLASTYGGTGFPTPAPYVPLAGSATETQLLARVDSLRTEFTRYGVTDIGATTGLPLGAQTPLTASDLARLLQDSTTGFGARALENSAQSGFGDVDVAVRLRLFDSFGGSAAQRLAASGRGLRQTIGLTYRIGSGTPAAPGDFLDLGTGSGEDAIGVRSYTDLVFDHRYWATIVVGWAKAQGRDARIRAPGVAGDQLLESWREMTVPVERGAVLQAEITPRYHLNDYLALGGYWGWRRHEADRYTIPSIVTGPPGVGAVAVDSVGMAEANARDEQRAGLSLTYSTVAAHARGKSRFAFEFTWLHQQSVASGTGIVPKRWEDRLQARYYTRLFGR